MKYNDNGTYKNIYVKALDSMPVGTEVQFDGQVDDIPAGWEQVEDKGDVYSTTEQKIGTWIDGKPLYRKVVEQTLTSSAGQNFNLEITNLDKIVWYGGTFVASNGVTFPLPSNAVPGADSYMMGIQNIQANQDLYFNMGNNVKQAGTLYLRVEYTKTTDQGGNS